MKKFNGYIVAGLIALSSAAYTSPVLALPCASGTMEAILYTTEGCPPCQAVKTYLQNRQPPLLDQNGVPIDYQCFTLAIVHRNGDGTTTVIDNPNDPPLPIPQDPPPCQYYPMVSTNVDLPNKSCSNTGCGRDSVIGTIEGAFKGCKKVAQSAVVD